MPIQLQARECEYCYLPFTSKAGDQVFCCRACGYAGKSGIRVWKKSSGYVYVSCGQNAGQLLHVAIAEQALGFSLPADVQVHHVSGEKARNCNENLLVCDRWYHALLHVRQRVYQAGGDPDTQRFCSTCKQCKDFTHFSKSGTKRKTISTIPAGLGDDLRTTCRVCDRIAHIKRNKAAQVPQEMPLAA